ncbi:hypothetical protein AK812_SmicGene847 [Symbiodinium microadriaticum]|uniref:Copia protein n=1 Tax=Symbiodinium microadriaticum TaxID=2951 RepID=A0A1Q9F5L1_SYMMI|nr:hypothetical protein AK812_SmicGene847 [Symbiodinium microadriaticum]
MATEQGASSSAAGGQGGTSWKDRDPPPPYDGKRPDQTFERWQKELRLWEFETEVPKEKWGVKILRQLSGSARAAAESLSYEELACEKGRDNLVKALKEHFAPHLESSLPRAFEAAIYGEVRSSRETFGDYVIRMEYAAKELERQGVKLGDIVLGYVMFRGANLSESQENQLLTWGEGKYDRATVVRGLRRLDKGVHETKRRNTAYILEEDPDEDPPQPDDEIQETFVGAQPSEFEENDSDDDYVYIGEGEMQEIYDEEHVQEALATYQDVRRSIREQKNSRGFYPRGRGRSSEKGSSKGFGRKGSAGKPTLGLKGKDPVRFTKGGTKIHVDMLKLRTRCARCGAIGHWAKECQNAPDARGKAAAAALRSSSSAPSSSARSGFFVRSEEDASPQSYAVLNEKKTECDFMPYLPTFGSFLRKIVKPKLESETIEAVQPCDSSEPASFTGVVTNPSEGVVDTAAQDGLIGKAALLRLADNLRAHGLKISWDCTKKAAACGVGGKAKVIGIARAPIGLAGINGLIELTVVADDVPLLLPIKLLKQLRAVVDLDRNILEIRSYNAEASLTDLPSGHVAVSVTDFAPEGWSVPAEALDAKLSREQFVLLSSGVANHSMKELKSFVSVSPPAVIYDGVASYGANVGSARGRCETEAQAVTGNSEEQVQDWLPSSSLQLLGLAPSRAASLPSTPTSVSVPPVKAKQADAQLEYAEVIKYASFLGVRQSKEKAKALVSECSHPRECLKGAGNQYKREIYCGQCLGRWHHLTPEELAQKKREATATTSLMSSAPSMSAGSMSMSMSSPLSPTMCLCKKPAFRWQVKKKGPTFGRHFYKCQSRICDFFLWDPVEREIEKEKLSQEQLDVEMEEMEKFQSEIVKIQNQAEDHVNQQAAEMERLMRTQAENLEREYAGRMELQAREHQAEMAEMKSQMAWVQGYLSQMQAASAAQMDGFSLVNENSQQLQMRTFCSPGTATPWNMAMERSYYLWDNQEMSWKLRQGWLPRQLAYGTYLTVVFQDEESMVFWNEEYGKHKALTHGERKRVCKALDQLSRAEPGTEHKSLLKLVSPSLNSSLRANVGEAMATLDLLRSESFWLSLRASNPNQVMMVIDDDDESLQCACEVAEWQSARGKSFAILSSIDSKQALLCHLLVRDELTRGQNDVNFLLSNDAEFYHAMFNVPENVEEHQDKIDCFPQNQEAHQEKIDCFHQNQEAHQEVPFDVVESQHGGSIYYESQHGGSLDEESQHGGSFLSSGQKVWIEEYASKLRSQRDYSIVSLEKFIRQFPIVKVKQRGKTMKGNYLTFGLYTYGNQVGLTNRSRELPNFVSYINERLKFQGQGRLPEDASWTTFALGIDAGANPHRDVNNRSGSRNYLLGFGKYQHGEVWKQLDFEPNTKVHWKVLPNGERVPVSKMSIKNRMCELNPKMWHGSEDWTGTRYLLSAFTSRGFDDLNAGKIDELRKLKFPVPRNQKMLKYDGTEVYVTVPSTHVYVEDEADDEEDSRRQVHRHVHEDMQPTTEEKRLVKKLHENLGHPEPKMMARSMRIAHAKPHLVRYAAKKFKCEICQSRQKPKPARPAVLPRFYEPGKVVGVDVVFLRALDPRDTFPCLNITDWGTGYQMVERLKSVDASHTWRTFLRVWGRTFGIPEIMIVDLGPEFRGDFADQAAQSGALIRHTAARSPWQAGKTERSGSHFKAIYDKARDMAQVSSWEEIKTLLLEVESAKNRYGNRSGFSPMQRQIGHSLRLPASLLSDDPLDPSLMIQSAGDEMRRILEIRRMAQEAYIKTQTETAITKAKHARTRTPLSFLPGETVYVYRQPRERKRRHYMTPESHEGKKPAWTGPGVVLAVEGPNVWVSMKGELWKVSMEQCRAATSEEQFAKEMLSGELEALKEDLGRSSVKRSYKDMTDEGAPLDPEELGPSPDADELPTRPAQRLRQVDPARVPVPGGDDPDQELEEALAPPHNLPETLDQFLDRTRGEGELNRQASAREPEPMPTPPESMTREASMGSRVGDLPVPQPLQPNPVNTAAQVMRNERLDGHPPGSPPYEAARRLHRYRPAERPYFVQKFTPESTRAWYSLHEHGWKLESDSWEEVSKDVIIRVHEQPRNELCHPNRIRGALMPRRLKHRCTYMVDECDGVSTLSDNWVRKGKKTAKTEKSWTGFTVFSSGPIDLEAFAGGKPCGQGEIFDHEIKPEDREGWRETDLQEWNKVAGTGAIKVLSPQESAKVRKLEKAGKSNRIIPSRMVRRMKPAEQPGEPAVRKSRWCIRGDKDPDLLSLERFSPTLCSTTFGVLLKPF